MALTATATLSTFSYIKNNLQMQNLVVISDIPKKDNIKYSVVNFQLETNEIIFKSLINEIEEKGEESTRSIIFCRKMSDVRSLYSLFHRAVGKSYIGYKDRPYAMFHSQTSQVIKDFILASFGDPNGSVRVLIATIAFGMGVDCKGLNNIIHYGPPANMDDYFQETGRAGRDGKQSYGTLILYKRCLNSPKISKEMREYTKVSFCRRKQLLKIFGSVEIKQMFPKHKCCDVCSSTCDCDHCDCKPPYFWNISNESEESQSTVCLSEEGKAALKESLMKLREERLEKVEVEQPYCGVDILSGFPLQAIDDIIKVSNNYICDRILDTKTSLFDKDLYKPVLDIVNEKLAVYNIDTNENNTTESSCSSSSSDETNSEIDLKEKFHACLKSSSSDNEYLQFYILYIFLIFSFF